MPENFDYFKKTRKSAWNLRDAFDAFKLAAPNLTNEQQLTEFHQLLLKADDSVIKSWLTSWKSFCKKETSARTMQPSTSNPNINVNMQASTNHGFSFGNVTNYSCNNYKKRESTDHELNAPPSKRYLSEIRAADDDSNEAQSDNDSIETEADQDSNATPSDHPIHESNQPVADNEPSISINCQDDIWACWRSHLENDSVNTYSLERLGIIQCGNQLQCRDHYPPELYNLLIYGSPSLVNPISNHADIFDHIFDQTANQSLMARLLDQISYDDKQKPQVLMVATVIKILLQSIFSNNCVCEHEGNYSHYAIWPLLDTIVNTVTHLNFHCGEYYLGAVDKELARRKIGGNHHYNADGCISTAIDGVRVELVLLEVSGPFKLNDESRSIKDHVKAGYGLVAMLNEIARLYNFASFETFSSLRIFFVHAKKNKLRFWSFEMPSPGLYVLNLINSVIIPDNCASCELPVESICIELWNLRSMLRQTLTAIDELKHSHIANQRAYNRALRNSPDLKPTLLTDSLRISHKVKLDVNYIPGYEELAINSDPF